MTGAFSKELQIWSSNHIKENEVQLLWKIPEILCLISENVWT